MDNWRGRGGVIGKIRKDMGKKVNSGVHIETILSEVLLCHTNGTKFDPSRLENRGGKRPPQIATTSIEAEIIADAVEAGLSLTKALYLVNEHLAEEGREGTTMSAILSVIQRLNPQIKRIQKRKQGSSDPKSPWARARKMWVTQLMIRLGTFNMQEKIFGPLEKRWDRDVLGHLSLDQIGWWDETHRKCMIGGIRAKKEYCLQFKQKMGCFAKKVPFQKNL